MSNKLLDTNYKYSLIKNNEHDDANQSSSYDEEAVLQLEQEITKKQE